MFIEPKEQVNVFWYWNKKRSWGFTKKELNRVLIHTPPFSSLSIVPVLDVSLSSVFETFEEARIVSILKQKYDGFNIFEGEEIKESDIKLYGGNKLFKPKTLSWKYVDVFANKETEKRICVKNIRRKYERGNIPDSELLWAAVYFPEWIRSMKTSYKGEYVPYADIAGYKIKSKKTGRWNRMPVLAWDHKQKMFGVDIYNENDSHSSCCIPIIKNDF